MLVIAAARGLNWQSLRSNGGTIPDSMISQPAYSSDEIAAIEQWVRGGGALLLAIEHYPYGRTMAGLAGALRVDVRDGYLADTAHLHRASLPDSNARGTPMESRVFASRANQLLSDHIILRGRNSGEQIGSVVIFGGTSFCGPPGAAVLIRVSPTAEQRIAAGDPGTKPNVGCAQGLAFSHGRGRVVVLGDSNGFVTAQERSVDKKVVKVGLSMSDSDNRQTDAEHRSLVVRRAPVILTDCTSLFHPTSVRFVRPRSRGVREVSELASLHTAEGVQDCQLVVWSPALRAEPKKRRIEFAAGAVPGHSHRFALEVLGACSSSVFSD